MAQRKIVTPLLGLALLAATCGGGGTASTSTTVTAAPDSSVTATSASTEASTTTTDTPTTTAPAAPESTTTTTTGADVFYSVVDASLVPPAQLPGSGGAMGSGCEPGSDDLPAGIWFGFVAETTPTEVTFDLACFFFGDAAHAAAAEDGTDAPNDFYIRNQNPKTRVVAVASDAVAYHIDGVTLEVGPIPYGDWPTGEGNIVACPGAFCGVWLYINDDKATEVLEQYIP